MAAVTTVTANYVANTSNYVANVNRAAQATQQFASQSANGFTVLKGAMATALGTGAYMAVMKSVSGIKNFAKESFNAAARVEELDISMRAIGKSTGKGYTQIKEAAKAIKDMGIETASASQMAIQFAQNNLDLASAAKVARVAQDLAVVAGLNSTETMNRLTQGILRGETELLKSAGIAKSAGQAYEEYAKSHGKSTASLTAFEKQTAVTNMILEEGGKVAGTYEASMNSAGKVMRSFARIFNDIQVAIGSVLLKGLGPIIKAVYDLVKGFSKSIGEGGAFRGILDGLATQFGTLTAPVVDFIKNITRMFSNKVLMAEFAKKLQGIVDLMMLLAPLVLAAVAAYVGFKVVKQIVEATQQAIDGLALAQKAFNAAVLANPYVLVAAIIIGALVAIALAMKYFYDKSEAVRDSVDTLIGTVKNIASVLLNVYVRAWKSLTGQTDDAMESSKSLSENLSDFVKSVAPYVAKAVDFITKAAKGLGIAFAVLTKAFEIIYRVIQVVIGVIKVGLVAAWKSIVSVFNTVMDALGPVGDAFQKRGKEIGDFFANLGPNIVRLFQMATQNLEPFVNSGIDAINKLIDAYNLLPFDDIQHVDSFKLPNFEYDLAKQRAIEAENARDAVKAQQHLDSIRAPKEDTAGGGGGGDGGKSKAADALAKKLADLKDKFDRLKESLKAAADAYKGISEATAERFGEKSNITKAFGSEGDISSAISQYDNLKASVDKYFDSLIEGAKISEKTGYAVADLTQRQKNVNAFLKESTQKAVDLYRVRKDLIEKQKKNEEDYARSQSEINKRYDLLDKQAQESLDAIEDKYRRMIPVLEAALAEATAAYDKENKALADLVSKRDSFLGMIASSFTSFVNNLTLDEGTDFKSALTARLEAIKKFTADLKILMEKGLDPSLIQDFVSAGVSGAGAIAAQLAANPADIAVVNDLQKQLAEQVASFTTTASAQWFDAGIAQQQAVVAPLMAAAAGAQAALDLANASRVSELEAAQAHANALKEMRKTELDAAYATYLENDERLKKDLKKNEEEIDTHAKVIQDYFTALQLSMPEMMKKTGNEAISGLIAGLKDEKYVQKLRDAARRLGDIVRRELEDAMKIKSPSKVTENIGHQIAQGLVDGMLASEGIIRDAATSLAGAATPTIGLVGAGTTAMPSIAPAAVTGAQGNVMIAEGAVQMNFGGSMDNASREQIQAAVDEGLLRLAREIRRTM